MAVIDIDPTLTPFKPICMINIISDRIKMDFEYITILINSERCEIRLKVIECLLWPVFSNKLL